MHTTCSKGTPFTFFVREGDAATSNLVFELDGGGCCFNAVTCALPQFIAGVSKDVTLARLASRGGIGDHSDSRNPVAGWTHVFVPYCTGDAHLGNKTASYGIHHMGRVNAGAATSWALEHVKAPQVVLTTGISAGAVGSYVIGPHLMEQYPDARHVQFADSYAPVFGKAGYNGGLKNWDLVDSYAKSIPLDPAAVQPWRPLVNAYSTNISALAFPHAAFSSYVSNGDTIESGFYLDEGCGLDGCDWGKAMREALGAIPAPNYHYFIGKGGQHGVMAGKKLYTQTDPATGTKLVDWLSDMLGGKPVASLDCSPHCGVLADEEQPPA